MQLATSPDRSINFVNFNKYHREKVYVANGKQVSAEGKGTICVNLVNKYENKSSVTISEVLYVPGNKVNLISVKRLTEKVFVVSFSDKQCEINKGDKQIAVGDISIHQWHRVYCHRDIEVLKSLASGIFFDSVQLEKCNKECDNILNFDVCLGMAERKNRTLIEMARCMIIEANFEKSFWGEAVVMANYIQNRLPASDIEITPFENWYDHKPSINHFRRFGSKCYTFVPDERRQKLDSKSIPTIFVGYELASKAYRYFVPATKKVIISRNVKFIHKDSDWKNNSSHIQKEHQT